MQTPTNTEPARHSATRSPQGRVAEAPILLRAEALKKHFGGQIVLDGVDLELRQREVVLLRGENGSGKTTLLNILTGNLEPDAGAINYLADGSSRTYRFPRRWWQELNPFDHFTPEFVAREGVCRSWQDIRLFHAQSLRENIAVAEPGHPGENPLVALVAPGRSSRREKLLDRRVMAMLARLGLDGRADSSADKISLGQSKRVAIARALAAGARILFLDEPLAGLDRKGIDDIIDLLRALVAERDITLVIIEHALNHAYLEGLIKREWVVHKGRLEQRDARQAASLTGVIRSHGHPDWFPAIAGESAEWVDEQLPRGALLTRFRRAAGTGRPLLEIWDMVVRRGSRVVIGLDDDDHLTGFNLTLHEGEIALLQAPNGWGKSTLFAALAGTADYERGEMLLAGHRVDRLPAWERARLGLRPVSSDTQGFASLSVKAALQLSGGDDGRVPMAWHSRRCDTLSGGEKRRLALASGTPGLVALYDEPFIALDDQSVMEVVKKGWLSASGCTLIFSPSFLKWAGHA